MVSQRATMATKNHKTVIICDYPKFLIGLEGDALAFLVRDVLKSTDEVSAMTVIRYLAGDLSSDVEPVYGTPAKRQLIVTGNEGVVFEFDYLLEAELSPIFVRLDGFGERELAEANS